MKEELKQIYNLKSVWLITWEHNLSYGEDEEEKLRECGIQNKIVDLVDSRWTFDRVLEHTKSLYKTFMAGYRDKISLLKDKEVRVSFFQNAPLRTCYQDELYKELLDIQNKEGIESEKFRKVLERWGNYPQYIWIGHNPGIFTRKVKNVKADSEHGKERLQWEELTIQGEWRKKSYE